MIKKKERNGHVVYEIPKGPRADRIQLYEYEIAILEQLLTYSYVRGIELRDFAHELRARHTGSQSRGSTGVRLQRLRDANLIKSYQADEMMGYHALYKTHYSTYTKSTLDVLFEIGTLSLEQYETNLKRLKVIQKNRQTNIPKIHSIAVAALGTRLYMELTNYLNSKAFTICKGVHHPLFSIKAQEQIEGIPIYPDLVMELPNKQLTVFEVDGGRQLREVLSDKVKKYQQLMKDESFKGYKLRVVFLPIDSDFIEGEGKGNVLTRIHYIKAIFPFYKEWETDIEIFCYRYTHLFQHLRSCLYNEDIVTDKRDMLIANKWIEKAAAPLEKNELFIKPVSWQSVLPQSTLEGYAPHAMAEMSYYNKIRKTNYLVYHMRTGNVKSQQILEEIYTSLKGIMRGSELDLRVMLVYEKKAHRENDTIRITDKQMMVHVLATSLEEWEEGQLDEETLPFYEMFSKTSNYSRPKENLYL